MKAHFAIVGLAIILAQSLPVCGQAAVADSPLVQDIQAMEQKFFEHDFSKESLGYRVARLEKFAFGEPSTGPLAERIQRLTKVIDLHKALVPQPISSPAGARAQPVPAGYSTQVLDGGMPTKYPHISNLEYQFFGETFQMDALSERLTRLEMKAFGKASSSSDAAERTDALEEFIQRKLHSKVDNASSVAVAGQSVDPAVLSDTPPDAHTRMLTRVAWCEQHLFGRTFPNLHLPQRLHQLNAKLFPQKQSESDFQLMDQLDVIVREVVMTQHPPLISSEQR